MTSLSSIVSIEDVSLALGVSPKQVKHLCKKHNIPVIKAGHQIRFTQDSVDRLLEAMTWRYTSYGAEVSTTSTTPFRGETNASAYAKLQGELQKQKRAK
jgi:glycerol-3-phosphate responsive antiterminator